MASGSTCVKSIPTLDFWLLGMSFAICGFSTNGLIGTHLIAFCVDNGYSQFAGAGILASVGVFSAWTHAVATRRRELGIQQFLRVRVRRRRRRRSGRRR